MTEVSTSKIAASLFPVAGARLNFSGILPPANAFRFL